MPQVTGSTQWQYKFKVEMTCGGCEKAVNAVLSRTAGVDKVEIDLPTKLVTVDASISAEDVAAAIGRTGKACERLS